jgi:hypothetical protein
MRIPIRDAYLSGILKEGIFVKTNGDGGGNIVGYSSGIEGKIGELKSDGFYVWNNIMEGSHGNKPIEGYKYSWFVRYDNTRAWIEILNTQNPLIENIESFLKFTKTMKNHEPISGREILDKIKKRLQQSRNETHDELICSLASYLKSQSSDILKQLANEEIGFYLDNCLVHIKISNLASSLTKRMNENKTLIQHGKEMGLIPS